MVSAAPVQKVNQHNIQANLIYVMKTIYMFNMNKAEVCTVY